MINEHLLCGTLTEISDHFENKVKRVGELKSLEEQFVEIPTMPIQVQLNEISSKNEPKTGLLFYFLRNVVNHADGTFSVNVNLATEMVWLRPSDSASPYHLQIFNEIVQSQQNTDVISTLQSCATNEPSTSVEINN